jgi:hypothetical protein
MATKKGIAPATAAPVEEVVQETAVEKIGDATEMVVVAPSMDMFQEDAGGGLANLGANDFAIPFISILQKGSPQVSRANAKHIKGAESGMIMNTVTGKCVPGEATDDDPGGILFIPCGYQKQAVRWKNRDSGGGLVCHYLENDPALKKFPRNDRGQLWDPESKDIIIDTAYHFGLVLHEESGFPEFAVISMASTQLKKSRTWNTVMRRIMFRDAQNRVFNPPSYSHVYRLTTVGEAKDTYDWFGWNIISEGQVKDVSIYKMAREFAKQVESGNVRVSAPPQEFDGEVGDAEGHAGAGEGVPF